MKTCKGCGAEYRRGSLAFVLAPDGFAAARVCPGCARRGVTVVARAMAPVVVHKAVRTEGLDRALRQLRTLGKAARAIEASAKREGIASHEEHAKGRAEGFEGAIELLKRECGS